MEEEEQVNISPYRLKRFLTLLAKAQQEHEQKHKDIKTIKTHLEKIKKVAGKAKKEEIHSEVDELMSTIHEVLNREKIIINKQRHEAEMLVELKNRINTVEKELVMTDNKNTAEQIFGLKELNKINTALDGISLNLKKEMNKVEEQGQTIEDMKKKGKKQTKNIKKIEKKEEADKKAIAEIKKKEQQEIKNIKTIEAQLKDIEKKYKQLKKNKDVKKTEVKKVEKLILKHKNILEKRKDILKNIKKK